MRLLLAVLFRGCCTCHCNSGDQNLAFRGPIPEGEYSVNQSDAQTITAGQAVLGELGAGAWPGGTWSWGTQRVWLNPHQGTETFGRSAFSIHGGAAPGSAGCIDLTIQATRFFRYFSKSDRNFVLVVKYGSSK